METVNEHSQCSALKLLQIQFLTAIARWANFGKTIEPAPADLPDEVNILQSCGYQLRRVDFTCPKDITPLRNGQKGIRIIITCLYSGQRCFLEKPTEECHCIIKADEEAKGGFWEVSAAGSNTSTRTSKNEAIVETGSDTIPKLSKELQDFLKFIVNCLMHLLQGTLENQNNIMKSASTGALCETHATSSPNKDSRRLSGFLKDIGVNPPIIFSPTRLSLTPHSLLNDSPARYRSLDTLTKTDVPEPGKLTPKRRLSTAEKTDVLNITRSSPNICLQSDDTISNESTVGGVQVEEAIRLMKRAVSILEQNKSRRSSPSNFLNPKTFIAKTFGPNEKTPSLEKTFSTPNLGKGSVKTTRSGSKLRTPGYTANTRTPQTPLEFTGSNASKPPLPSKVPNGTASSGKKKLNSVYAHVKSTIPKTTSVVKTPLCKK